MLFAADIELLIILQTLFAATLCHKLLKLVEVSCVDITRLASILVAY